MKFWFFKEITKILKTISKKKEESPGSPFYSVVPLVIRPEPLSLSSLVNTPTNKTHQPSTPTTPASPTTPTAHANSSSNNNNSSQNNGSSSSNNSSGAFSFSALSSVLPSPNFSKKDKTPKPNVNGGVNIPINGWTNSWDSSSFSSSSSASSSTSPSSPFSSFSSRNPLYQPRMFADVVLTDSHPRRSDVNVSW